MAQPDETIQFECPRCGSSTDARFYGPCPSCVNQLQNLFAATAKDVTAAEYEPKMNVTPNAVALKE